MLRIISLLVILFYFLVEIIASVAFANEFGVFGLFLEFIVSFILGVSLLTNFRGIILHSLQAMYSGSIDSSGVAVATLMQLIGTFLLIFPGVFSDVIGCLLIFLGFVKVGFKFEIERTSPYQEDSRQRGGGFNHVPDEDIIDVEVEVVSKRRKIE